MGILSITSCSKKEDNNASGNTFSQQVESMLSDSMAAYNIPGLTIYSRNSDGELCHLGIGLADVDNNVPMQKDTKMRIASVSKTFLATVVLQLWEEHLLDIDHLMSIYLPDSIISMFPYGDQITVRHLLDHTSGLPDFIDDDFKIFLISNPFRHWTPYDLLDYVAMMPDSVFNLPEEIEHYSNTGYILLGLITESLTGISMEQNIRERIITPLNLSNTFSWGEEIPQANYAKGYLQLDETTVLLIDDQTMPMYFEWASGQMISTVEDLYTFFHALVAGDLYNEQSTLDAMLAFTPLSNFTYGLGISKFGSYVGHNGLTLGFNSFATVESEGIVVLIFCYNSTYLDFSHVVTNGIKSIL